ncbi:hypothetical protein F5887DRAFT_948388 [Amanita rubescens]|nr:hypothetical protein F5887DRAFT_948388 [Amanita rubescens]
MASARFPPNSNDFKLPSLKDLNFPYQSDPSTKRTRVQSRPPYPPQYAPYPQQQTYPDQIPSYPHYQSQYIPPRPSIHPYPSPAWNLHQQPPPPPPPPPTTHIPPHALSHPPHVAHLPPAPLPPPQQQQQQQQHQQQPQQQQQQQPQQQQHQPQQQQHHHSFSRSSTIASAVDDIDDVARSPQLRDGLMVEVIKHCSSLYSFAKNCAQFQTLPHAQPTPSDLSEMSRLAFQVVHMLEDWKRRNLADLERIKLDSAVASDDSRPPKRPWEDTSGDGAQEPSESNPEYNVTTTEKVQSTAEQDMELIRTKRATSTAGGTASAGQPKSKYRKRSRATPPGKCHSCNIRETPEWRRGPDGARTLCNACGLHYAKLMRKKEKNGNGSSEQISLEDLRASARSGDLEKTRSTKPSRAQQPNDSSSSADSAKQTTQQHQQQPPPPQQHHQGSFQIMNLAPDPTPPSVAPEANHVQPNNQQAIVSNSGPMTVPWNASAPPPATIPHPASAGRYAPDQFQHQSFMRSVIPQASPR